MNFISFYQSALGEILISSDDFGLSGLWFFDENCFPESVLDNIKKETPVIKQTKNWLDIYFKGKKPDFTPPLNPSGTEFRMRVWEILRKIPYGKTITYNDIALIIAKERNIKKMSAQAVGGAVGHNKISVIIPCHRVIGSRGNLTGYSGGLQRKLKLLELEGALN